MDELIEVGERRVNMMRVFNAVEGIDSKEDRLPEKFFSRPLKDGPTDGIKLDKQNFDRARAEYYLQSGWDETSGVPTLETLEKLGLGWLTDRIS